MNWRAFGIAVGAVVVAFLVSVMLTTPDGEPSPIERVVYAVQSLSAIVLVLGAVIVYGIFRK